MSAHYLDLCDPSFSTRSKAVEDARAASWYARTPFGLAILRHREAGLILRDRRLRQGSYAWPQQTGLTGPFADFWTSSVIGREGPEHKRLRTIAQAALKPEHIDQLTPVFERIADDLLDHAERQGSIEFMSEFSMPFAGQAICALLGLPLGEWRRVAEDAARLGLAMGIDARLHQEEVNAACLRLFALADELLAQAPNRASAAHQPYVSRILAAAGEASREELLNLIVISIFGGVDTTRSQLAHGMALLIEHPDQWQLLKREPERIPDAIEEMIRAFPTTTWSTREALEAFEFNGTTIEAGQTVHILVNATARDPLVCAEDRFDITAARKMHFGFGGGAHHCLGSLVARTDMAAAFRRICMRVERFAYAGEPQFLPDSGNTSPVTLPLAFAFEAQSRA